MSRRRIDWTKYKKIVKKAKQAFFDNKIYKIVLTNKRSWDLINQIKK